MDNNVSPSPLYPDTVDGLTEDHITYAFRQQMKATAETCISALDYYSDSVVDPVNAAADALGMLNGLYYDSDLAGFKAWLADEEIGPRSYCSEGLADYLVKLLDTLFPEED